jgi:hypothetical protein
MEGAASTINFIWQLKAVILGTALSSLLFIIALSLILSISILTFRLLYDKLDVKHWYFLIRKVLREIGKVIIQRDRKAQVFAR